jgi:hypothetical protein
VDGAIAGTPAREKAPTAGHECLAHLVQGTVCKILGQEEIKPHKERRDAEFEQKMAEVLCVYCEVQVLKAAKSQKSQKLVARTTRNQVSRQLQRPPPDLPPEPGIHPTFARDHHNTMACLSLPALACYGPVMDLFFT